MNENEIYFGTGQIQVEQVEKLSLEFGESSTTLGLSDRNSINIYQTNRIYNDTENDQVQMKLAELDEPSLEVEHPPELPPLPSLDGSISSLEERVKEAEFLELDGDTERSASPEKLSSLLSSTGVSENRIVSQTNVFYSLMKSLKVKLLLKIMIFYSQMQNPKIWKTTFVNILCKKKLEI